MSASTEASTIGADSKHSRLELARWKLRDREFGPVALNALA
jgi:hypothetical protein